MSSAINYLIDPLEKNDFLLRYWGKEYFISKGQAERYSTLFSWDALSDILSTHRFEFPRLRLFRGGHVIPPDDYISYMRDRRGNQYSVQNSQVVLALLNAGAMLHITSIGETWKPLATIAAQLEQDIGAQVQVNLHAGFAASHGFHTHWDGHDVYAIQIAGRKKWRLFGFTAEAPLAVPPDEKHGAPSQHVWEGILNTGDMLYIPRGYWHCTEFLDDESLHLTFAVQHPTGIDFIEWLVKRLTQDAVARRDIPSAIFEIPLIGQSVQEDYLSNIRNLVLRSISLESLTSFLADYQATLGRVNHIHLNPKQRCNHASRQK